MEPDISGSRRPRRSGERRLVRAELQLLLVDLAAVEGDVDDDGAAGALGLTIARLARRAIAAGYLSEVELGRMVLDVDRVSGF